MFTAQSTGAVEYTLTASLQRGKTPPNVCPRYDTELSDGEAPVLDCPVCWGCRIH